MRHRPTEQQMNPSRVETATVQFWRNGVMATAQMTRETARQMVREGQAFVISGQAVGAMENGFSNS